VSEPVDVWALRLPAGADQRRASARANLLSEVVGNYGLGAELDRTCRLCGHPDHGKPHLVGAPDFDLSLAHAGPTMAVAIGRGRTVGVDVETMDRLRFDLRSARGVFTPPESAVLAKEPDWRLPTLALWTRKEAVVKAIGRGLAHPLDRVTVADPGTSMLDGEVFELEVEGAAFAVATFVLGGGEVLSVATTIPWPGVRWRDMARSSSAVRTRTTGSSPGYR
jgi:phosphopantetheinyl transferase (holo-ACP synthase)